MNDIDYWISDYYNNDIVYGYSDNVQCGDSDEIDYGDINIDYGGCDDID